MKWNNNLIHTARVPFSISFPAFHAFVFAWSSKDARDTSVQNRCVTEGLYLAALARHNRTRGIRYRCTGHIEDWCCFYTNILVVLTPGIHDSGAMIDRCNVNSAHHRAFISGAPDLLLWNRYILLTRNGIIGRAVLTFRLTRNSTLLFIIHENPRFLQIDSPLTNHMRARDFKYDSGSLFPFFPFFFSFFFSFFFLVTILER